MIGAMAARVFSGEDCVQFMNAQHHCNTTISRPTSAKLYARNSFMSHDFSIFPVCKTFDEKCCVVFSQGILDPPGGLSWNMRTC